jgi:hypothetical protein
MYKDKDYQQKYYKKHKSILIKKMKNYIILHYKKIQDYQKNYRKEHCKKLKLYANIYRQNHKKEMKINNKIYYLKNKKIINRRQKDYYKNHKKEYKVYRSRNIKIINEHSKEYRKLKRKIDINFKLGCNLRNRIYQSLKGINKSRHTLELLGCSIEFLKKHLAKKFAKGMHWSNYGKWHIDHIRPCASFDLSKPSEQKKCFNYKNLQPLWAKDNYQKRNNDKK